MGSPDSGVGIGIAVEECAGRAETLRRWLPRCLLLEMIVRPSPATSFPAGNCSAASAFGSLRDVAQAVECGRHFSRCTHSPFGAYRWRTGCRSYLDYLTSLGEAGIRIRRTTPGVSRTNLATF